MHGKWKVSSQFIGDERVFQVYRLRDIGKVDHSGNREYAGEIIYNQDAAYAVAKGLNDGEGRGINSQETETPGAATPRESR